MPTAAASLFLVATLVAVVALPALANPASLERKRDHVLAGGVLATAERPCGAATNGVS